MKLSPTPDFSELEKNIIKFWQENGILEKYLKKNENAEKRFRFLDGPITANNPMGVHHAWGRTYKDFFQRYKNMQGFKQRFQNGFDCQGLWLEVEEERSLGFNSKKDIEDYGIDKFSRACRARVDKFSKIQAEQSARLGMFMDWENSYYTMSETNNLYIWYFLKKCKEKGWLYKGKNSMPWCVRCGTAISAHELSDGGYKTVTHDSVFVKFPLVSTDSELPTTNLLIWTTTPWTLLSNVAVAVNSTVKYVKVRIPSAEGEHFILAKNCLPVLSEPYEIIEEMDGAKLVNKNYRGPFDELPAQKGINHRVIEWAEVSEAEGTGLVHIAPGAGSDDFELGQKSNLAVLAPLDEFGVYIDGYGDFTGKNAREINGRVYGSLKEKGLFYKTAKIEHNYPHCWRCKEPLVFRVTEEWFIRVEEIRPQLKVEAAKVNWLPDYVGKRMQDWLDNMRDWPISRRRYWGLALPFYECSCGELTVIGSKEELRSLAVAPSKVDELPELHRPWIDEIKIKCPKCGAEVARVPYVGDCWLDAGIVPFSTLKYLEDRNYWQAWFPAEFITEYVAQVKLWFYSTLFMSVALEGRAPYTTVFTDGFVVDETGEAMHKSKGNAVWFDEAVEKMGADVMRWLYLRADNTKDLRFGYKVGEEIRRRFFLIFWNCLKFVFDYAEADKIDLTLDLATDADYKNVLDRWIISRLSGTVKSVTGEIENNNPQAAALEIESLVNDLSTWYIRRGRDRVGPAAGDKASKAAFYAVTKLVFMTLTKIMAPFVPFLTEEIYRILGGVKLSVHLEDWPAFDPQRIDPDLEERMELVRKICELGHAARKEKGIKVRQPLAGAKVKTQNSKVKITEEMEKLIIDELNVKKVELDLCFLTCHAGLVRKPAEGSRGD